MKTLDFFSKQPTFDPNNPVGSYTRIVIYNRWLIILASILLLLLFGYGSSNLKFTSNYQYFFGKSNPELQSYQDLNEKYTDSRNVLIGIESSEGSILDRSRLEAIRELVDEAWKTPYSTRVDAITNYQHTRALEDELIVEDLIPDPENCTDEDLGYIRRLIEREPVLRNKIINDREDFTAINITVSTDPDSSNHSETVMNYVRGMLSDFESEHPGMKTYVSGQVGLSVAFQEASAKDGQLLIPLMFLVLILVAFITTRSLSASFSALVIILFSIFTTMGLAGWMGISLTVISMSAPTIIMTLAIADSIHILMGCLQLLSRGQTKKEAIIGSMQLNFKPVLLTSLTTAIGFLSLNFNESPPFRDLGNIAAIGVCAAFLFSISLLPAMASLLPMKMKAPRHNRIFERWTENAVNFINHQYKIILGICGFGVLIIGLFTLNNEFNDEFIRYFDTGISFRDDTDHISEKLTGIYNIEYSLPSSGPDGITDPAYLEKIQEFREWFLRQEGVTHVSAFSSVISRINRSMHADEEGFERIPADQEEIAQYLLLYEMSLPYGLDLTDRMTSDKSETRLSVYIENMSSNELRTLARRGEEWLDTNAPDHMRAKAASAPVMFAYLGQRQISGMLQGGLIALLLISLILTAVLGNIRIGLISLIPNFFPVLVAFGLWGIFKGQINSASVMVFGLTLGIVVDDTVHFLVKYLYARKKKGLEITKALTYTFSFAGRAILGTSLILIFGFGVLAFSSFELNAAMGLLSSIVIAVALLLDMSLLPALLVWLEKRNKINKIP